MSGDRAIPSKVWTEISPGIRVRHHHGVTIGIEVDAWPAAERECVQLRAERDQALTLLRAIRRLSEPQPNDSMNAHFSPIAKMIDASHIFDDEGQQP